MIWQFFVTTVKMKFAEEMAYKANFFIRMLTLLTFDLILPFVTIMIYAQTQGFPGWSFPQIILFQGIFMLANAFDRIFFQRVEWSLAHDVRTGDFDRYLLYPVSTMAYLSFVNFSVEHVASVFVGLGFVGYWAIIDGSFPGIVNILLFGLAMLAAMLLIYACALLRFAIIIRVVRIGRVGELFRVLKAYGQYPVTIYEGSLNVVLRYIIPLSLLSFIPSSVLLEQFSKNMVYAFFAVIVILILCSLFWRDTLKHYTSAGG